MVALPFAQALLLFYQSVTAFQACCFFQMALEFVEEANASISEIASVNKK